jgi:hypothetical protein
MLMQQQAMVEMALSNHSISVCRQTSTHKDVLKELQETTLHFFQHRTGSS